MQNKKILRCADVIVVFLVFTLSALRLIVFRRAAITYHSHLFTATASRKYNSPHSITEHSTGPNNGKLGVRYF